MVSPKLACCNLIADIPRLKAFALEHGFDGIDWSFTPENLPQTPAEESALFRSIQGLAPLEVRYHCAFHKTDLGDTDEERAKNAMILFQHLCRIVSKMNGHYLTLHVGLGRNTTHHLSWDRTIRRLTKLVQIASAMNVRICLENLAWGWTSRPDLYEKLIRKSGAWGTLDIGHARVSPSIKSQIFEIEDFISPHPERFLNAHVYHTETSQGHLPPSKIDDLEARLELLSRLQLCTWWVLELHEEAALLQTLKFVRQFLRRHAREKALTVTG